MEVEPHGQRPARRGLLDPAARLVVQRHVDDGQAAARDGAGGVLLHERRLDLAEVVAHDVARRPVRRDPSVVEQHPALAERLDRAHVVRDEDERAALLDELAHALDAPVLEPRVADGDRLVDEEDVRLQVRREREAEPELHP